MVPRFPVIIPPWCAVLVCGCCGSIVTVFVCTCARQVEGRLFDHQTETGDDNFEDEGVDSHLLDNTFWPGTEVGGQSVGWQKIWGKQL